jgi:hypothetical protein
MENTNRRKDLVYTIYEDKIYLEWSEALKVLNLPRTSLLRTIEKLSLLQDNDFVIYKNRKLLKEEWVMNFWRNVSLTSQGKISG